MADPVLSAVLSGQRAILLSWTFGSNADFQVFWKSSSPPGQEYVLLATTNAFTYTTPDLNQSMTYDFYVRANVGATYFYSNVVELFVSCGKGVILSVVPPSPPPAQTPLVNVYAASYDSNIYKQTAQDGLFNLIQSGALPSPWRGGCTAPNGDVYFAMEAGGSNLGDIWKQTGGVGAFVALGQANLRWYVMGAVPNGDIYAGVYTGDIYKQTGGVGAFVATGQVSNYWFGMTGDALGNVYACVNSGDIYIKTPSSSIFVALSQTLRTWRGMCADPNGDIYCSDYGGSTYIRQGGVGNFVLYSVPDAFRDMAATKNRDIYACNDGTPGLIYLKKRGATSFSPTNDTDRPYTGMAAAAY
jgi:hypothetical protein